MALALRVSCGHGRPVSLALGVSARPLAEIPRKAQAGGGISIPFRTILVCGSMSEPGPFEGITAHSGG
jgi:hypothetical protein